MISCSQYDYIEIAAMYRLPLLLTFDDGTTLKCVAKDTLKNEEKQECMLVVHDGKEKVIVIDELTSMQASVANPHFDCVEFTK